MGNLINPFLFFTGGGGGNTLLTDLLAYYKLDEASGNRLDSHTSGLDLTETDGTVGYDAGENAAVFTGSGGAYLSVGGISLSDSFGSVNLWAKLDTAGNTAFFSTGGLNFAISLSSGNYYGRWEGTTLNTSVPVPTGSWTMFTCVYDGTTFDMYENGTTLIDSIANTATNSYSFQSFSVGQQSTRRMDGLIKHVGWWTRALTAGERTLLYNSGTPYPFANFT